MAKADDKDAAELLQVVLALGRRLRAGRPAGSMSLSSLSLLGTLNRLGPTTASRLATEERLQPQSLTRLVSALDRSGHIRRQPSRTDRRALDIVLTKKGQAALSADLAARRRWLKAALAESLTARERAALGAAVEAMRKLAFGKEAPP